MKVESLVPFHVLAAPVAVGAGATVEAVAVERDLVAVTVAEAVAVTGLFELPNLAAELPARPGTRSRESSAYAS